MVDLLFNTVGHTENNRRYSHYIDLNLVESEDARQWLTDQAKRRNASALSRVALT